MNGGSGQAVSKGERWITTQPLEGEGERPRMPSKSQQEEKTMGHNGNGKNGYFFKGLLIGSLGGALAGLLFAPKSGKKLREDIADKGSEVLKDGKEFYFEAHKKTKNALEDSLERLEDVLEDTRKVFRRK
jgi:gas vesicle protein